MTHSKKESVTRNFRAYVLIQTLPGRVEAILRSLRRMRSVQTVNAVTGPYDIVALVEVGEIKQLSRRIADRTALSYLGSQLRSRTEMTMNRGP